MSKELEALDRMSVHRFDDKYEEWDKDYETVENYLESIDNTTPSEALKLFEEYKNILIDNVVLHDTDLHMLKTIKLYILKAQEQQGMEKFFGEHYENLRVKYKQLEEEAEQYKEVLKIVFEKNVDIELFKICLEKSDKERSAFERYNGMFEDEEECQLIQEEFDLIKRYYKEKNRSE